MKLEIGYRSQLEPKEETDFAVGDCGSSCLAMLADVPVDDVSEATGEPQGFTSLTLRQLQLVSVQWDITLSWRGRMTIGEVKGLLDKGFPIVSLCWYPLLPLRFDPSYNNGHFVLIVGYEGNDLIIHDPYYRNGWGAYLRMSWDDFSKAWSADCPAFKTPRQGLVPNVQFPKVAEQEVIKVWWEVEQAIREIEQGESEKARVRLRDRVRPNVK